jgi:hypothetical protein
MDILDAQRLTETQKAFFRENGNDQQKKTGLRNFKYFGKTLS